MPRIARLCALLTVPAALSAESAEAQMRRPAAPAPPATANESAEARAGLADFRLVRREFGNLSDPDGNGLTGTVPLGPNMHLAIGRLSVPNFSPPRMEAAEIRRGYRGIAAIGFSLRF